jgi:hypothetical protein
MYRAFYFSILFSLTSCQPKTKLISFEGCNVEYKSHWSGSIEIYEGHHISNEEEFELANYQLALCLCEKYLQKPNSEIKQKILEIYNTESVFFEKDKLKGIPFDSILENRMLYFDAPMFID